MTGITVLERQCLNEQNADYVYFIFFTWLLLGETVNVLNCCLELVKCRKKINYLNLNPAKARALSKWFFTHTQKEYTVISSNYPGAERTAL